MRSSGTGKQPNKLEKRGWLETVIEMMIHTSQDLAKLLQVSPQTITRNATRHRIGRKVGRQWLFSPDEAKTLAELLQANSQRDWSAMGKTGMVKRWKTQ